jgi:hypothetical protein
MASLFYGPSNTLSPAAQWGVGNGVAGGANNVLTSNDFNFGQASTPVDYNSPAAWSTPDTSLSTPSATGGFGGYSPGGANSSGLFGVQGLGANLPTLQLGLGALSTGFNLYSGLKALGLAQDQFQFNKQLASKNLTNSVASYNTALTDRATSRAVTEGQTAAQRDAYINANKLSA